MQRETTLRKISAKVGFHEPDSTEWLKLLTFARLCESEVLRNIVRPKNNVESCLRNRLLVQATRCDRSAKELLAKIR